MTQERDPIERIKKLVLSHDLATEKELKDMEKEIRKEVDDAIAKAKVKQQLHYYFQSVNSRPLCENLCTVSGLPNARAF